jgi:hypothetical protein
VDYQNCHKLAVSYFFNWNFQQFKSEENISLTLMLTFVYFKTGDLVSLFRRVGAGTASKILPGAGTA